MYIEAFFVSEWDLEMVITPCTVDIVSGKINSAVIEVDEHAQLIREYVVSSDTEYEVENRDGEWFLKDLAAFLK